ncbi:hypothetical protein PRIO_6191 [Paenibacillus riograndensis SBR5]|uniref:Uncharacterized protein n=1 Tax=Paenibacillus riograndensis SBR5 TaxID=1073571 RepID=A0A0E3WJC3_9BACL|nr:hypothetical protein PRIO_6191 [Paenibacillus riograndensis SBR5]
MKKEMDFISMMGVGLSKIITIRPIARINSLQHLGIKFKFKWSNTITYTITVAYYGIILYE